MEEIRTKLVGVSLKERQEEVRKLDAGTILKLVREPTNPYDPNAIRVETQAGVMLGHLSRKIAADLCAGLDAGDIWQVEVLDISGKDRVLQGCNILLSRVLPFQ